MSLYFVFDLPKGSAGNTGVVVFVDRLSKIVHLAAVPDTIDAADPRLVSAEVLAQMRANAAPMVAEGQRPAASSPTTQADHEESRPGSGALSRSGHASECSESPDLRDRGARAQRFPSHPHSGQTYPLPNGGAHDSHEPALGARPVGSARRVGPAAARRPPALLDKHGKIHYHAERLLKRSQNRGHIQYLVQWHGEAPSWEYKLAANASVDPRFPALDRGEETSESASEYGAVADAAGVDEEAS
ncbi:unnamed protein product [Phytophthora fragariaefolia]|uniref:Unnamed protein product n=1 Tax=Phytophthora fragariaefolia TaxID=1490495 RepID=A0A9W6XVL0_9STRA|nr:unnamed protein product [Phytophthora fragariaefolia]